MAGELMTSGTPITFLDPPVKHPQPPASAPIGCAPCPTVMVFDRVRRKRVWFNEKDHDRVRHGPVIMRRSADGTVTDDGL